MTPEKIFNLIQADNETPELSFNNEFFLCKIVDIYDGDTVKVVFYLEDRLYKWNVRLFGINTPEMRPSRLIPNRKSIKEKAIQSRDYLSSLFQKKNNLVFIKCGDFDKYGRLLGTFFLEKDSEDFHNSINNTMIIDGYAKRYMI